MEHVSFSHLFNIMKIKLGTIRRLIREQLVQERAKDMRSANNLGLCITSVNNKKFYILVDVDAIMNDVNKVNDIDDMFGFANDENTAGDIIVAMMRVDEKYKSSNKQWGAAEVEMAAAKKGWGPFLYDIVMSSEGALVPDRGEGDVSPDAQKVWNFYFTNRKDVKHKLLDDENAPKTLTPKDDTSELHDGEEKSPLNYAYTTSKNIPINKLITNYKKISKDVSEEALVAHSMVFFRAQHAKWRK